MTEPTSSARGSSASTPSTGPRSLLAAGEPLPTHIRVHPYLTLGQLKLSKSTGTRVDPTHIASTYGTDVLRWWFCRDVAETADTDFTVERLVKRANEDLAGGVGNIINRIVSLVHRHRNGTPPDPEAAPLGAVADLPARTRLLLRSFELRQAAQAIVDAVSVLNQHLEETAHGSLRRIHTSARELDASCPDNLQQHASSSTRSSPSLPHSQHAHGRSSPPHQRCRRSNRSSDASKSQNTCAHDSPHSPDCASR